MRVPLTCSRREEIRMNSRRKMRPLVGARNPQSTPDLADIFVMLGVLSLLASVVWFAIAISNNAPAIVAFISTLPAAFGGLFLLAVGRMLGYLAEIAQNTRRQ